MHSSLGERKRKDTGEGGKKNLQIKNMIQTEPWQPKMQNPRIVKNYLNHSQHTRLVHRQRHHQALVWNTGPAQASTAPSRLAWLKLAHHQLNSTKIHRNPTSSSSCKNQNQHISTWRWQSASSDWSRWSWNYQNQESILASVNLAGGLDEKRAKKTNRSRQGESLQYVQ